VFADKVRDSYSFMFSDIDFNEHFKASEIEFKDKALQEYPDKVKNLHAKLLWKLQCYYQGSLLYSNKELSEIAGSMSQVIKANREHILPCVISKIVQK
jgi:hypothetical protein